MKTYLSLLLIAFMAVSVQGCSLRLPGVGVDIDGGGHDGPHHCPPGQAKKGRC